MATLTPRRKATLGLAFLAALAVGAILSLLAVGSPAVRAQDPHLTDDEAALLSFINGYRVENGLSPLGVSPTLTAAARWMSEDMAANNYLGHIDSLGRGPSERMAAFGYTEGYMRGEIARGGSSTPEGAFEAWRNSPGHNAVMLTSGFTVAGVGKAVDLESYYGWYWTVDFGDYDDSDGSWPMPTSTPTPTPSPSSSPSPTVAPTSTPSPTPTPTPASGRMVGCPAAGKWSVAVWSGDDDAPTAEAMATCDQVPVEAAYWLDPEWQAWLRYFAGHPELNSLPTLDDFQGILALGAQPTPSP
ncbi:MAG TPA: CAP domain-containing protein [Dehalococcoidia bacterium]|nr:CAP domain-containing protein [Dehalococcoidia bacterium]